MTLKVMIIDDEQDVAHLAAKRIRSAGYEVECLYEGRGAKEIVSKKLPNLILLDIWLPEVSGIDIFKELRADVRLRGIPIVFFSADPSKEHYCLHELRANGFIKKPYDHLELLKTINQILPQ